MHLNDALTLFRSHILPTLAQLVLTTTAAMFVAMMAVMSEANASEQYLAEHQQANRLPEAQDWQAEDRGHQPVPQQHDQATQQGSHRNEEEWDEHKMFL